MKNRKQSMEFAVDMLSNGNIHLNSYTAGRELELAWFESDGTEEDWQRVISRARLRIIVRNDEARKAAIGKVFDRKVEKQARAAANARWAKARKAKRGS